MDLALRVVGDATFVGMGANRRFRALLARAKRVWDRRPVPTVYSDARVRFQQLSGIPGRVHPRDQMLVGRSPAEIAHYRQIAMEVLAFVDEGLRAGGRSRGEAKTWLDFGCGYGRVTRFLVQDVPAERVWCFDVDETAVRFCSKEFGVNPLFRYSEGLHFDVVYAISVVTHLDEPEIERFIGGASNWLNPGGILLFTFHGDRAVDVMRDPASPSHVHLGGIESDLVTQGFAFRPYEKSTDCGTTWHRPDYLRELVRSTSGSGLEEVLFTPAGLDNHQDVIVFQRKGTR